jgi:hypothetical protein
MIEGSGSVPRTNGSGSRYRRPKNIWILRSATLAPELQNHEESGLINKILKPVLSSFICRPKEKEILFNFADRSEEDYLLLKEQIRNSISEA